MTISNYAKFPQCIKGDNGPLKINNGISSIWLEFALKIRGGTITMVARTFLPKTVTYKAIFSTPSTAVTGAPATAKAIFHRSPRSAYKFGDI